MFKRVKLQLLACIIIVWAFASCAPKDQVSPEVIRRVHIAHPLAQNAVSAHELTGTIREAAEMNLAFRVAGPIKRILVKEGDHVREGELVAEIDPRDYEIQQAVYQAQYDQVKAEFERLTELNSRKSVADNDYEKAVSGEKMLRMKLKNAEDQLRDTKLYAPFSGYIQTVKYEEGELVNTGMTIAALINVKSFLVEVDLPMALFIQKDSFSDFSCTQPLVSDSVFPLRLAGYRMKANNSQLYRATFSLDPGQDRRLAPGMPVTVTIHIKNQDDQTLSIPLKALCHEGDKSFVWLFDPSSTTVKKQEVETGEMAGNGQIRIQSGLSATDEIVVSGIQVMQEGMKVERIEPASETNVGGLL
ncbi:RND family efflux transporter, MFP subunit [Bacteroidales bacterium 6E]|nr:RND family efflux transporter, MFP subunit [Bacteroidales bacterium 6E]